MNSKLSHIQNWPEFAQKAGWSVAGLAKLFGVSARTLQRHFQETHKQTPETWLAELRWRQTLELLGEGASVKITASELGYRHASTFSREFKKRFGESPRIFSRTKGIKALESQMAHKAMELSH